MAGPWVRGVLVTLLTLGVVGTMYEVAMIRFAPILYGRYDRYDPWQIVNPGGLDTDRQGGKRTYALRSVYETLNAQLPASAIIQHNPATENFVPQALYSGHDFVAGDLGCVTAFGGDQSVCNQRVRRLVALFKLGSGNVEAICQDYGIDVLVAKDTDPAWHDRSSWIWSQRPVVANDYVRAFSCATATADVHP